jgi:hypothetical protein
MKDAAPDKGISDLLGIPLQAASFNGSCADRVLTDYRCNLLARTILFSSRIAQSTPFPPAASSLSTFKLLF